MSDTRPTAVSSSTLIQTLNRFLGALPAAVASRVLSAIDQHPVPIHSASDRRKGGQFGARLRRVQPYGHRVECRPIYRQAFLWGAANYLTELPHEELVVGFGIAEGRRTRIAGVMKIRGDAETVSLSLAQAAVIHAYLDEDERRTIILVHNHPSCHPILFLLGVFFGPKPLPSLIDRDFGSDALLLRIKSKLAGAALGKMRFFVVQNNMIGEFSGITAGTALDFVRRYYMAMLAVRSGAS